MTGSAADPLLVTVGEGMESFVLSLARSASIGPEGPEPLIVVMLDSDTAIVVLVIIRFVKNGKGNLATLVNEKNQLVGSRYIDDAADGYNAKGHARCFR